MELPTNKERIGVKWVYKTKANEKGGIEKQKARLVAKGYSQRYGIDYDETFGTVDRMDTIRTVLSIATQNQWLVYQMDLKYAFLNGILEEEIYVNQLPRFIIQGQ